MSSFLKQTWLVLLLAVGFGAALAAVERSLAPRIAANQQAKLVRAINEVVSGGASNEAITVDGIELYRVLDNAGATVGWAYPAEAMGYADKVQVLIGLDATGQRIVGVQVLKSNETPGLGDRVKQKGFRDRFIGKRTDAPVVLGPGENGVDGVTGATYSSRALVDACNVKREAVSDAIGKLLTREATTHTQPEQR